MGVGKASVTFRPGRSKPYRVRWYERRGDTLLPREKSFEDGLKAGAFRAGHELEADSQGELAMSSVDRARWWRVQADCSAAKLDIEVVVATGIAAIKKAAGTSEEIGVALGFWEIDANARNLRNKSVQNITQITKRFYKGRESQRVDSFTVDDLLSWVAANYSDQSSRDTMLGRLLVFFRWCASRPRRWCEVSQYLRVKWPQRVLGESSPVRFYTAEEAQRYLDATPDRLKYAVATAFFLGVRPFELCRMREKATLGGEFFGYDAKKNQWRIHGTWAKTRAFRLLYSLPDAWYYWRLKYMAAAKPIGKRGAKFAGAIVPMSYKHFNTYLRAARKAAGLRDIDDGFRHSFATHAYNRSPDGKERGVEWALAMVGHRGKLTTFSKHYDGKVDAHESEAYYLDYPDGSACEVKTRARIIIELPPAAPAMAA